MVTPEELDGLNGAIQFGIQVELYPEMSFSGKDLVDMLVLKARRYQFADLRCVQLQLWCSMHTI